MKMLLFVCFVIPLIATAMPEERLAIDWDNKALPFFRNLKVGTLTNSQGLKLRHFSYSNASNSKSLIIVPGRTEPAIKYAELIYDLKDAGLNIHIMDHQGQGESSRILSDSQKGHVVKFSHYVNDLELFIKQVVNSNKSHELYLIAHSMGGAISAHLIGRRPTLIKKAVLVAPMLKMNTQPYSEIIARLYSNALVLTGQGKKYAPGRGPYIPEEDTFEINDVTHSQVRFNISKNIFARWPSQIVAGPTARWVSQSLKATHNIDRLPIEAPILLLQAGLDEVVKPGRQEEFCKKGLCEIIRLPEAAHEILMEKDSIREEALKEIRLFFGI